MILPDVGDHHLHAVAQEHPRHAEADAAGAAGDERDLAFDFVHIFSRSLSRRARRARVKPGEGPRVSPHVRAPMRAFAGRESGSHSSFPHTSSATSTMRRSLAHCSSSARTLPSSVEAKPHWPLSAKLIERREFRRLVDAALDRVLAFELAGLGGDDAEHDDLALGQLAQRREIAGALGVVFHEIAVDVGAVEQHVLDAFVTARAHIGAFVIAAAQMHGDDHVARACPPSRR